MMSAQDAEVAPRYPINTVRFVHETSEKHASCRVQSFIHAELSKPSKAWVYEVVESKRECESVRLRTGDFVLLPDTNANRRQFRQPWRAPRKGEDDPSEGTREDQAECLGLPRWATSLPRLERPWALSSQRGFNWLAIVLDPSLRTIRDLRGEHVPMLERMHELCLEAIEAEFGYKPHDVMVFANYPPSVYRLHFHFCAPFHSVGAFDAFRMHPLCAIVNNLRLRPDYYEQSTLCVPVHTNSEYHRALVQEVT
jgi:hypothetical protein